MQEAERAELIAAVVAKPLRWRADKLAARVGLTAAERERLNIRTIGAVDLDKAARKRRRHERKVDAIASADVAMVRSHALKSVRSAQDSNSLGSPPACPDAHGIATEPPSVAPRDAQYRPSLHAVPRMVPNRRNTFRRAHIRAPA